MSAELSRAALAWLIGGEWRAHPARAATAALSIALGVALGFAVHLINASALDEFAAALRAVNGEADLQVRAASPLGFDEALYPRLARLSGVEDASPAVELPAAADGRALTLIGLDPLRAARVTPSLIGAASGAGLDERAVFLSTAALEAAGKRPGDRLVLAAAGRSARFVIAGLAPGVGAGEKIAVVDIAAAQWRFGELGRLQRIDLALAPCADAEAVRTAVAAALPADARLVSRRDEGRAGDSLSRAYRVNLDMLAMTALLTGGFLVFSAQSLSAARRASQFALLRVLGAERRALLAQMLLEGVLVGAAGALAGLGLGLGLAEAGLRLLGGDLGGGYFDGARPRLIFAPGAAAAFFALGLAAALAGSLLPARQAARAQPAVALKAGAGGLDAAAAPRPWLALGLLGAGSLAALAPPLAGLPLLGYLAMALLLAGGVAAMPWLARHLLSPLHGLDLRSPPLDLTLKRLWRAPSQAATALCGMVAATSLMIAMAVMVASFRGSVEDWLTAILPGDLYLRLAPGAGGLGPAAQVKLAATPGVASVRFQRTIPLRLAAEQPPVALIARRIERADPAASLPLIGTSASIPPGAVPVWLSEPAASVLRHHPGQTITLPLEGGRAVFVAGIWRDYARQQGAVAMDEADYSRLTGDDLRTEAEIRLVPGASAAGVIAGLRAALPADQARSAVLARPGEIRRQALRIFDRSFTVTYLLEAVAVLVGLAGVAASVSAQTLARAKEFGMLRHVGVRRSQIAAMLAVEGALLGALGAAAGVGLGLAMSQVLIHVINPQSFHWTMQTRLPLGLLAAVAAAQIAAAAGAALLAGRLALSAQAVLAVREDW